MYLRYNFQFSVKLFASTCLFSCSLWAMVECITATGIPMAVPSFFNQKVSSYWNMHSCLGVQSKVFVCIVFFFFQQIFDGCYVCLGVNAIESMCCEEFCSIGKEERMLSISCSSAEFLGMVGLFTIVQSGSITEWSALFFIFISLELIFFMPTFSCFTFIVSADVVIQCVRKQVFDQFSYQCGYNCFLVFLVQRIMVFTLFYSFDNFVVVVWVVR